MILTPAYGRDYKSKAAVQADFDAGKDFMAMSFDRDGYITKSELVAMGVKQVQARYGKLMKVCMLKVAT